MAGWIRSRPSIVVDHTSDHVTATITSGQPGLPIVTTGYEISRRNDLVDHTRKHLHGPVDVPLTLPGTHDHVVDHARISVQLDTISRPRLPVVGGSMV